MRKLTIALSLMLALAVMFGAFSFAAAEDVYEEAAEEVADFEEMLEGSASEKVAAAEALLYFSALSELPEDFDVFSYLPEGIQEANYSIRTDFIEMDKRAGMIAELEPENEEYPTVSVYCFENPTDTLADYAAIEGAVCNAVVYPLDEYGFGYGYLSYDKIADEPYFCHTVITELENGSILEVVYQHKAKRVSVAHSSKSFCVPDGIIAEETEPKEENEIAEYSIAPISDTINSTPVLIQVYEKEMNKDQQFYDAVVQLADEQKADISFVTRGDQEYIMLFKVNDDGDYEIAFCFEEDGRFYELCFTTAEDGLPMVNAVSNSLA